MHPVAAGVGSMVAGRIAGPGKVIMERVPLPSPGHGEVRIRLEGCGVCGSNLPPWEGRPWFDYPLPLGAPGHEGWGRIEALGAGVHGFGPGQRVAFLSERSFAEYDTAPVEAVIPIPPALDGVPVPGEALGCAWNVFRRSEIRPGQRVAVVGIGFLGALLTQLAARSGARVLAASRRPFALELARRAGAEAALALSLPAEEFEARAREWSGDDLCDVVVEATGLQEPLSRAARLTRTRGRLVIAGYHQDGPRTVDMRLWNWRGLDVINAHERDPAVYVDGMRAAVAAAAAGLLDAADLCTHRFPLDRLGDALEAARSRPAGFLKAVVEV